MSIFIELNPNMKLDEMRNIIKQNSQKAVSLNNKIKAMDAVAKKSSKFMKNFDYGFIGSDVNKCDVAPATDVEEEEEEYLYYYDNMMDAIKSTDDLKTDIYENLPSFENGKYGNIVLRIKFALKKEREVYEELKEVDHDALEEIRKIDYMIDIIRNHHSVEDEKSSLCSKEKNNIIFLKTSSGNVYAESDLASIDSEYYPAFKELLESIEDGTFKNVQRFSQSHQLLKGISEIKEHGIRIVFDKINKDSYIVLDIFIKRSTRDMGYVHQLTNRVAYYKKMEDDIKSTLSEDIIENDRTILENIKKGLDNKYIVKTKGGGTNGI